MWNTHPQTSVTSHPLPKIRAICLKRKWPNGKGKPGFKYREQHLRPLVFLTDIILSKGDPWVGTSALVILVKYSDRVWAKTKVIQQRLAGVEAEERRKRWVPARQSEAKAGPTAPIRTWRWHTYINIQVKAQKGEGGEMVQNTIM